MATVAILEGIDGVGKTAFAQMLKTVDSRIQVCRPPLADAPKKASTQDALDWVNKEIEKWATLGSREILVYDRFPHPSQWVYGSFFTEGLFPLENEFSPAFAAIDERMASLGVKFIIIEPQHWDAFIDKVQKEPDEYIPSELLPDFFSRYRRFTELTRCAYFRLMRDWLTPSDAERVMALIRSIGGVGLL